MKFDEENKVIVESMNCIEASAFIKFLQSEIARHKQDIVQAKELIKTVQRRFSL